MCSQGRHHRDGSGLGEARERSEGLRKALGCFRGEQCWDTRLMFWGLCTRDWWGLLGVKGWSLSLKSQTLTLNTSSMGNSAAAVWKNLCCCSRAQRSHLYQSSSCGLWCRRMKAKPYGTAVTLKHGAGWCKVGKVTSQSP